MPGNGTFNLTNFFRAMGIKNPHPEMRESVQPVVNVGDFSELTPLHRPARASFGGDVTGVVAEFSTVCLTSRSPGGTIINGFGKTALFYGIDVLPANFILTFLPSGVYSLQPFVSVVEGRSAAGLPLPNPGTETPQNPTTGQAFTQGIDLWIPQGQTFIMSGVGTNIAITDWWLVATDIPASENPEA